MALRGSVFIILAICALSLFCGQSACAQEERYRTGYERYGTDRPYRTSGWRSPFFVGGDKSAFGLRRYRISESKELLGVRERSMRSYLDSDGPSGKRTEFRLRATAFRRSVMGNPRRIYGARPVRR